MSTNAPQTPDWDLTPFFASLGGQDYTAYVATLVADLDQALERVHGLSPMSADVQGWTAMLVGLEQLSARAYHLDCYLGCMTAAESANEKAQQEEGKAALLDAKLEKVFVAVRAALKDVSDEVFDSIVDDERLEGTRYYLSRMRTRAARTMSADLEGLNADLSVDGINAWGRLYDRLSGTLQFELDVPGQPSKTLPVAMTRSLLEDADPAVRAATRDGAAAAWSGISDTVAACLNAISGTRLTLYGRRGVEHFLDPSLFDGGIERKTLDTMWAVVRERQGVARRFLSHKAKVLGMPRLGFHDLMAPLPSDGEQRIEWAAATERVRDAFASSYPALGQFADHAFTNRWIDHAARANKRPGGFCTSSPVLRESRIFMTYNGGMGDVQTLAHELGHGFHNWLMRDMRFWSRRYPMTLAETASTFAEQLVTDAVLQSPTSTDAMRAAILDTRLQDADAFLLNIPMRFDFEHALYERRASGEVAVSELKQMMEDAQRKNYGDALDPNQLDPWFWASKLHFYITYVSFYNFPYTFGYLFSKGLFARAKREGAAFLPTYEALLRNTGSATAEVVARDSLGVDLQSPEFWNESIDMIENDLEQFKRLTDAT